MSVKLNIFIVDYGFGNLYSLTKAFKYLGVDANISDNPDDISKASAVILPGVGAFGDGVKALREKGFFEPIIEFSKSGKPILGICLGMQFLFEYSEEFGKHKGLGLIKGGVKKIPEGPNYKVPHIGWNSLLLPKKRKHWKNTIFSKIKPGEQVYFVHSYAGYPEDKNDILANTEYGDNIITAAMMKNNIIGTQFHPEKSGQTGLKIIEQFIKLCQKQK